MAADYSLSVFYVSGRVANVLPLGHGGADDTRPVPCLRTYADVTNLAFTIA